MKTSPQTASVPPRILIFTDVDGTLLDHHTYSFDTARPALDRLDAAEIPVILTTSKTLPEVLELKQRLGNRVPCIVENGSSVWIPAGYFAADDPEQAEVLGVPVEQIRAAINALPSEFREKIRGFQDMSVEDVSAATGLDPADAARAMQRSASEPFVWSGTDEEMGRLRELLADSGVFLKRGGRFYSGQGNVDKSDGVRWLVGQYRGLDPAREILTVALGDGHNDIGMLEAVDLGFLVENPAAPSVKSAIQGTGIRLTGVGPAGWNQAIQSVLDAHGIP